MLDILLSNQREFLHQILKEATNGNPWTQISSAKGVQKPPTKLTTTNSINKEYIKLVQEPHAL